MATRTIANGGGNWNATGTWVEGIVPVNGDAVVATGTSGQLTVNVNSACTSIILTGYTAILTINATLTVAGTVTFVSGQGNMVAGGSGILLCNTTATLTSGGKTLPCQLQLTGTSQTYTLGDTWTVNGVFNPNGVTQVTLNGNTLNCTTLTVSILTLGTTNIVINGTGTYANGGSSIGLRNNLEFAAGAGTITLGASILYNTGTLKYTSGTIDTTTNSTVLTCSLSTTLNTSGMTWRAVTFSSTPTITLTSNLNVGTGTFTISGAATVNGAFNVNIAANYTATSASSGTATYVMTGTGNLTSTGTTNNSFTFNTAGTITLASNFNYGGGTLTWTAGTVANGGFMLNIQSACTLATSGMTWLGCSILTGGYTVTIKSLLNISGTLTTSQTCTFAGTSGFTCGTWTGIGIGRTFTLQSAVTYSVTGAMTFTAGTFANPTVFASSSGSVQAILTITNGATMDMSYCNATRIDSSGINAATVWTYKGVLTTATNWQLLPTQPLTVMSASAN